ncbi:anti-sigma B factor antagonist [Desulfacinum hydrothermale DSM 13146]|uniref:Anti-sigma factor antagonist n=1 Tax=Desulfacinum hydrothermale DSM 13146 TaxID=1121390 RepID=A0A1W1X8G0_9BACT|nr:STAS domain-containing protein [Desulfacinum hydrothermale]SMC20114.1 anti-sigma B factor antagonist [Desulfacinum hydrothermale DSM 13146]
MLEVREVNSLVELKESREQGVLVVEMHGKLDITTVPHFKERSASWVEGDHRALVLDFAHVSFVDSSGLGSLVALFKHIKSKEGRLALCCLSQEIQGVFSITRLDRVIPVYEDRSRAVEEMKGQP